MNKNILLSKFNSNNFGHRRPIRRKVFVFAFLLSIYSIILIQSSLNTVFAFDFNSNERIIEEKYSKQVLKNSQFNYPANEWSFETIGDETDLDYSFSNNRTDIMILGEENHFELIADPPDNSWQQGINPDFPTLPDTAAINEGGCFVSHQWAEDADQSPSVHWTKNISMPLNMSDYIITSANLSVIINATVKADGDNPISEWGIEVPGDATQGGTQHATYDYARFYVLISDRSGAKKYEVAYFQTVSLGSDSAGVEEILPDTYLVTVPEEALIFYLTDVLSVDYYNFSVILGIRLWCEDNWNSDKDEFTALYIKSFNLTFSYTKKIDKFSLGVLSQQISALGNETTEIRIDNAFLQFKYKLNSTWPEFLSPNSEIVIIIGDRSVNETIKLRYAGVSFKNAKDPYGYRIDSLLDPHKNTTINLKLAIMDTFPLNQTYALSIDDATLTINYVVITRIPLPLTQGAFLILGLLGVVLIALLSFIIKQNVIEPRKRRIIETLKLKTQVFDDAKNIRGIYVIGKSSGQIKFRLKEDALNIDEGKLSKLLVDVLNFAKTSKVAPHLHSQAAKISSKTPSSSINASNIKTNKKKKKNLQTNAALAAATGSDGNLQDDLYEDLYIYEFNIGNLRILVADSSNYRSIFFLRKYASERLFNASKNYVDMIENRVKSLPNISKNEFAKICLNELEYIFRLSLLDEYTFMPGIKRRILEKKLGDKGKYLVKASIKLYFKKLTFTLDEVLEKIPLQNLIFAKSMILDLIEKHILITYEDYKHMEEEAKQKQAKSGDKDETKDQSKSFSLHSGQSLDKTAKWVHSLKKARELQQIQSNKGSLIHNYNALRKKYNLSKNSP
ncbi:MAG: hypothetical protein ACTSRZ_03215 [Promethearchaeota archaeon]